MELDSFHILSWLTRYQYAILFPLATVEGPFVTVLAGFLAATGTLSFWIAYIIVVAADILGDGLYYAIGRYGGRKTILFVEKLFSTTPRKVASLERQFAIRGGKILVIGKITYSLSMISLISAGIARYPFGNFLWYTILPTLPKSLLFLLLGYYFGESYTVIKTYLNQTASWMLFVTALLLVTFLLRHYLRDTLGKFFLK